MLLSNFDTVNMIITQDTLDYYVNTLGYSLFYFNNFEIIVR